MAILREFTNAVANADLVIVTGTGGITDAFPEYARNLLETLALAVRRRRYIAMVGQGIGPLHTPKLLAQARVVLPHIDFIGIREDRASLPLLISLGVGSDRVMTTGDEAIEMVYRLRRDSIGEGLGVNLRIADYSGVDKSLLEPLREVLRDASRAHRVPMVPLPISHVPGEADVETIRWMSIMTASATVRHSWRWMQSSGKFKNAAWSSRAAIMPAYLRWQMAYRPSD